MESAITIRGAIPSDTSILAEFMTQQAMETEGKTLDNDLITKGVSHLILNPHLGKYYVALNGEESILGMIMIHHEMKLTLGGFVHWVNSVYVKPDSRQKGIFRQLYSHVRDVASKVPLVKCIRLYVDLDNKNA